MNTTTEEIISDVSSMYDIITTLDNEKQSELIFNSIKKGEDTVLTLIEHSMIDVNMEDKYGRTLITLSYVYEYNKLYNVLMNHPDIDINKGYSLLRYAIEWGDISLVKKILKHPKIDVNNEHPKFASLLDSASWKSIKIAKLLLDRPDLKVNEVSEGDLNFEWQVSEGNIEFLELLLKREDFDVNAKNSEGYTLLMLAFGRWWHKSEKKSYINRKIKAIRLLLAHPKIDITMRNNLGKTAWDHIPKDLQNTFPELKVL